MATINNLFSFKFKKSANLLQVRSVQLCHFSRYWQMYNTQLVRNVMAHAQKPDLVFPRNGQVHLNRWGRQFSRLLAAEVYASALVMLDIPHSEVAWEYWLLTPFISFPFTSPPVRHRVPPGSERALTLSIITKPLSFFACILYCLFHIQELGYILCNEHMVCAVPTMFGALPCQLCVLILGAGEWMG